MPPTPVSGAPGSSHEAADTVGIQSDQRSKSMRTSYTTSGFAVDSCSARHDTAPAMTRKLLHVQEGKAGFGKAVKFAQ
jgi:hypothetical protein